MNDGNLLADPTAEDSDHHTGVASGKLEITSLYLFVLFSSISNQFQSHVLTTSKFLLRSAIKVVYLPFQKNFYFVLFLLATS